MGSSPAEVSGRRRGEQMEALVTAWPPQGFCLLPGWEVSPHRHSELGPLWTQLGSEAHVGANSPGLFRNCWPGEVLALCWRDA